MADYTYNDALSRLVKSLDMKSHVAYISDMTGIHSSNIYKYISNKKVLGINSYKAICEKIDADPGMYLNDTFNAVLLTKPHGKLRAVKVLKATDQSQYIDALKEHGGEYFTGDKFYISLKYEESHYDIIEIVGNAMNDGTEFISKHVGFVKRFEYDRLQSLSLVHPTNCRIS